MTILIKLRASQERAQLQTLVALVTILNFDVKADQRKEKRKINFMLLSTLNGTLNLLSIEATISTKDYIRCHRKKSIQNPFRNRF